jgi:hypothetical protein
LIHAVFDDKDLLAAERHWFLDSRADPFLATLAK